MLRDTFKVPKFEHQERGFVGVEGEGEFWVCGGSSEGFC